MENIRQAVEWAQAQRSPKRSDASLLNAVESALVPADPGVRGGSGLDAEKQVWLNEAALRSHHIVAHDGADPWSRHYDLLATQVIRAMDLGGGRILGVTSPSPACGKTVTSINLALSLARRADSPVTLMDFDLQRAQVAKCVGVSPTNDGINSVLEGRSTLRDVSVELLFGSHRVTFVPAEARRTGGLERGDARAKAALLQTAKRDYASGVIIIDLPPVLAGNEVVPLLPYLDCILLVGAAGLTTKKEIEECYKHLDGSEVIRFVLNKSAESVKHYGY